MVTRAMVAVGLGALAAGAGCTLLIGGNLDYHEVDAGGGGATGSSTVASSAASGGASATASSAASTTASSGSGGSPAMCRPLHSAEDCGAGERCTVIDTTTGATGCIKLAPAPLKPFEACGLSDKVCPAGAWCDSYHTGVCRPFCTAAGDCGAGDCVSAVTMAGNIPGISVCTAQCDPVGLTPCGKGVACEYDGTVGDLDCFASQKLPQGFACSTIADCAPGLVCAGATCAAWCHPAGGLSTDCDAGQCEAFSNLAPTYDGAVYGFCM